MKTKQTIPTSLPVNAKGFIAPHLRDASRLALYRADGTPSNTYPSGMDLNQIRAQFFNPGTVTSEGFLVA